MRYLLLLVIASHKMNDKAQMFSLRRCLTQGKSTFLQRIEPTNKEGARFKRTATKQSIKQAHARLVRADIRSGENGSASGFPLDKPGKFAAETPPRGLTSWQRLIIL
jgi:hypothetical protein